MKYFIFSLLLVFGMSTAVYGQTSSKEMIRWSQKRLLKWSDFKGPVDKSTDHVASTNSGIQYGYSWSKKGSDFKIDFETFSFFKPKGSWSIKSKQSDYILKHEQLHFDITELFARKLRKTFAEFEFTQRNYERETSRLFDENNEARQVMQHKYDEETNHSINKKEQQEWNVFVKEELEKMKAYKE